MKEIVMSIKPKWWRLIASGEKTVEIRKSEPKKALTPFKVYVYQTQDREEMETLKVCVLADDDIIGRPEDIAVYKRYGRIVGEFCCTDIEPLMLTASMMLDVEGVRYMLPHIGNSCLTLDDLDAYGQGKRLYGWKIANVRQYADPKPLSAFGLSRPPQSWCYVKRYAAFCGRETER